MKTKIMLLANTNQKLPIEKCKHIIKLTNKFKYTKNKKANTCFHVISYIHSPVMGPFIDNIKTYNYNDNNNDDDDDDDNNTE